MALNHKIASSIIEIEMKRLQLMSYQELNAIRDQEIHKEIVAEDGKTYQVEVNVIWDSRKGGDLRVMVSVDDGGWSAFKPLMSSFIVPAARGPQ
jgi:hypothetical protein